jgi:hypothetical protein
MASTCSTLGQIGRPSTKALNFSAGVETVATMLFAGDVTGFHAQAGTCT